jgi:hypothetical protein
MKNIKNCSKIFLILIFILFLEFCVTSKNLKYVENVNQQNNNVFTNKKQTKTIQPNDFLYIDVLSVDDKTASIFNN